MGALKFLYYHYFDRKNMFNKVLDQQNTYLIHKVDNSHNRFCEMFFSCVVSNESIDIYDLLDEMRAPYFSIDKNKYEINKELIKTSYKWMAIYYVINFSNFIENKDIKQKLNENLFDIYDFDQEDKELYQNLQLLNSESESLFQANFIKYVSQIILKESKVDLIRHGLTYNIFYNSYNNFISSYTRYIDIESWLKYA